MPDRDPRYVAWLRYYLREHPRPGGLFMQADLEAAWADGLMTAVPRVLEAEKTAQEPTERQGEADAEQG